jgi:membrane-bound serine protease (ClpP class)
MDYLTIALILIGLGVLLLVAEILVPTGGILVVAALLFFAVGVGTIAYYGTTIEAVVAIGGLAIGLPAAAFAATAAWRRMSLDTVLEDPATAAAGPTATETDALKGRTGKTVSPMRPSGTVEFDGKRVDAMTEGIMLDAGVWVRCVDVKRGQVIVRKIDEPADMANINPQGAAPAPAPEPKAGPPASEEPRRDEPPKPKPRDDFDDFDIGLDKT